MLRGRLSSWLPSRCIIAAKTLEERVDELENKLNAANGECTWLRKELAQEVEKTRVARASNRSLVHALRRT